jgi:hypothetical protein
MLKVRHIFFAASLALISNWLSPRADLWAQSSATILPKATPPRVCRCNGWTVVETASFWVCCYSGQLPAAKIADRCEELRGQLCDKWLANKTPVAWAPKCMVVLHPNEESYLAAVGKEAAGTSGSSVVERLKHCVAKRRIDLRGDRGDYLTAALPHELTHVVLADHFSERNLPRWADEGMAILADTQAKRDLHLRDLRAAMDEKTVLRLTQILPSTDYPPSENWGVFYGQSVSIVDYLVRQSTPHQFVRFLDAAQTGDYDRALHDFYGIRDMQELDRLWAASVSVSPAIIAKNP